MSEKKQSFIAKARRDQIFEATIKTLDDIGYADTSLAQIAKRTSISTALISYHFDSKADLMHRLLQELVTRWFTYIFEQVQKHSSPTDKLEAYILSSLTYQVTFPASYAAMLEIIFNSQLPGGTPLYKVAGQDNDDPIEQLLEGILLEGQRKKEFVSFPTTTVKTIIQGAISEYPLSNAAKKVELEEYGEQLVTFIFSSIKSS